MSGSNAYTDSHAVSTHPLACMKGYEPLAFWVVTKAPRDVPEWPYVARKWEAGKPVATHYCSRTLGALRLLLRRDEGCQLCIDRDPNDDAVIVETWL